MAIGHFLTFVASLKRAGALPVLRRGIGRQALVSAMQQYFRQVSPAESARVAAARFRSEGFRFGHVPFRKLFKAGKDAGIKGIAQAALPKDQVRQGAALLPNTPLVIDANYVTEFNAILRNDDGSISRTTLFFKHDTAMSADQLVSSFDVSAFESRYLREQGRSIESMTIGVTFAR